MGDMLPTLLAGAVVTLEVTLASAVIGFVVAIVAGLARRAPWLPIRAVTGIYVEIFRGTSTIVQLFYAFFVLPLFGLQLPPEATAILVLGLNTGAYGSEVVRAAIQNVPRAQVEATVALNMPTGLAMRRVILPQAFEAMLPPFGNLIVELLKSTSLISLITIHELAFQGRELARDTGLVTVSYVLVLLIYFALAFPMTRLVNRLERRIRTDLMVARVP